MGIFNLNRLAEYFIRMNQDKRGRNRFLMGMIALLFLLDYLMFCYHADKNPFNIFPSFPVKDGKKEINIYLPDLDGKSLMKESMRVHDADSTEGYVRLLFQKVVDGSEYENTSVVVPVDTYIRKVWIYNDICAIDAGSSLLKAGDRVIPGSEKTFIEALTGTILENIPSIKKVILLDRGIPGKHIWEY